MPDPRTRPLVSVISPTLNQSRYIETTLRSVMRQTYPAVEHLVVDGGSTDGTHDILRAFEPEYDLTWWTASDSGMYQAVNRGLERAAGEILAYLNTDDAYCPWTIETVVDAFAEHPGADLVYGDILRVTEPDHEVELIFSPRPSRNYLTRAGSLFQPAVFWRRGLYERLGGFDESLVGGADLEYWLRAMQHHRFVKVDEVLAIERMHPAAKSVVRARELSAEERGIRDRYGGGGSFRRAIGVAFARVQAWFERRRAWVRFAQSPRPVAGGPWRRFRAANAPRVQFLPFLLAQLPLIGRRFVARAVRIPGDPYAH